MKIIATNDLHLASRAPISRIDPDYPEEMFELLAQIEQLVSALQVQAVLLAGDLFHVRHRIGWDVLIRFAAWCRRLRALGCDVLAIPGNHDMRYDRYESIEHEAIGFLFEAGILINVSTTRGCPMWMKNDGYPRDVVVMGVPYPDAFDFDQWCINWPEFEGTRIVMGHCFANKQPGRYFGDVVHGYGELLDASGADVIVLGHDHSDRGVLHLGLGRWVVDLGALSRGAMSETDIHREIKIALIDTDPSPLRVQQVRLKYRAAGDIFDLELREKVQQERAVISEFVEQLRHDLTLWQTASIPEDKIETYLNDLSLSEEVRTRLLDYITKAESVV